MNVDDGVVLAVIQITGDPSAERTAPPRSTHVRSGDVSSFLIQQGEGEVDGDPAARRRGGGSNGESRQGFAKLSKRGGEV